MQFYNGFCLDNSCGFGVMIYSAYLRADGVRERGCFLGQVRDLATAKRQIDKGLWSADAELANR